MLQSLQERGISKIVLEVMIYIACNPLNLALLEYGISISAFPIALLAQEQSLVYMTTLTNPDAGAWDFLLDSGWLRVAKSNEDNKQIRSGSLGDGNASQLSKHLSRDWKDQRILY